MGGLGMVLLERCVWWVSICRSFLAATQPMGSEGGLVGGPATAGPGVAAALLGGGTATLGSRLLAPRVGVAATLRALAADEVAAGAGGLGDLGGGPLQRRADLFDVDLDAGALRAVLALEVADLQCAGDDHALALLQGLRDVLGHLPPGRAPQEERVAVLPLVRLLVEGSRRRRDGEVGHRGTGGRELELRVVGEVADDGDVGLACHGSAFRRVWGGLDSVNRTVRTSARARPHAVPT